VPNAAAAAPASRGDRQYSSRYLSHCRARNRLVPVIVGIVFVIFFIIVQVIVIVELCLLSAHGCSVAVAGKAVAGEVSALDSTGY
jgi:hypothetical protein